MRICVPAVRAGERVALDPQQARHALAVLRLRDGDAVEAFDAAGRTGAGVLRDRGNGAAEVEILSAHADSAGLRAIVASAVPKGDRADWMIEKLGELGVERFVPLSTERAVVVPAGQNKILRWRRLAQESARQSRRHGVMAIDDVATIEQALAAHASAHKLLLATETAGQPLATVDPPADRPTLLLIGPEGGWSDGELARSRDAGAAPVTLTATILRIETAAVVAAGVVMCRAIAPAPRPA